MKYKCVIFDCDGVLVDSETISASVLVKMANKLGAKMSIGSVLEKFAGKSLRTCLGYVEDRINHKLPEGFEQEFRKRTFEEFSAGLKPIDGIHNLLEKITVPYCVASSGPLEKIRHNLRLTNLIEKFDGRIFSSYEIGSWKPDPGIFLHAAGKMGFNVEHCAVIEDSLAGIKAARKGGFDVFGFVTNDNMEIFQQEGAVVFSEMNKLVRLLMKV
ncbi:HAD family hydrolase [Flagellimonas sp. S3867]|uniref:HAD family hydrolase n=1 Tax=Flagellimonas sp. S3867 TaxID=2768063 RepID=UPI001684C85D|nr:HAD family hydrolase [Flagellimonas sp. S3867]